MQSIHHRVKTYLLILLAFLLTCKGVEVLAQKDKKLKKASVIQLNDSLTSYSQSDIFAFPNVNKGLFYTNPDKLKKIQ